MNIEDSIVLVTGANRGIGRSLVKALLARGVRRVYAGARSLDSLDTLVKEGGERLIGLELDVTKPGEVAAAARRATDVTLLFNNAGVIGSQNLLTSERPSLELDFATNFYGMLDVTRAFLPAIEKGRGGIVNLLTLLSYASMPALGGYSAAKAAALSLTQALRADLSKRSIAVFGVFPGAVDTDMIRGFDMPKTSPDVVAGAILDGITRGDEDIYPDPMARELAEKYRSDPKSLERVFGSM
jgi:NAD(P)-dependent dehydrogenase (short-subunit alcohol dehydrogenase family)